MVKEGAGLYVKAKLATWGVSAHLFIDEWLIDWSMHQLLDISGAVCRGPRASGHHINLVEPDSPWYSMTGNDGQSWSISCPLLQVQVQIFQRIVRRSLWQSQLGHCREKGHFLEVKAAWAHSSLLFFNLTALCVGSYFPNQELNPQPLLWKHGVLTTGPPGKFCPLPKTAEADASIKAGMIPLCLVTVPKEHPGMRERGRQRQWRNSRREGYILRAALWNQ